MKVRSTLKGVFLTLLVIIPIVFSGCENKTVYKGSSSAAQQSTTISGSMPKDSFAIYEVTSKKDKNAKLYLLGSIHVASADLFPLPKYAMDLYKSCDYLAVECDVVAAENNLSKQTEIIKKMQYPDPDDTLYNHLDHDVAKNILKYLSDNGYGNIPLEKFNAATIEQLCSSIMLNKTGLNPENGIDRFFLNTAKGEKKKILEVESYDFQLDMLYSFPDAYYNLSLPSYYEDESKSIEQTQQLYSTWRKGDVEKLKKLLTGDPEDYEALSEEQKKVLDDYNKIMLTDRNIGMVKKAEKYMDEGKRVFFVVGAAHIISDGGMIDLLKEKGYTVKRL